MNIALIYIVHRAVFRVADFIRHWYVDASKYIFHSFVDTLERSDERFAVKVTLRHFFEPLYGDYSFVGRILGIIFRAFRIIIGFIAHGIITIFFLSVYIIWIAVIPSLIAYIFYTL